MPKPNAQLSKFFQNVYGITSKKFELFLIKNMKNGNQMKSFQSIVITLVRGYICSFLQARQALDFVLVVYDLIELIIEVSYQTIDYFILNPHTQHTSLIFNECLFHLCDCMCSNVICVCSTICGSNQKVFDHFICFQK